jgi:hypothetical protein
MALFECRACRAKDGELQFLREQLDKAQKRLLELADPGAAWRVDKAERGPRSVEPKAHTGLRGQRPSYFPGYEPDPMRPKDKVEIE